MFEPMEISEPIYEGVVELFYKKLTRADANRAGIRRKIRGKYASSNTYHQMSERACRKAQKNVCRSSEG